MAGKEASSLHQLVYLSLFLAIVAVILGGFGIKAYYDIAHNNDENQTVNDLTVKNNATVDKDLTVKDDLVVEDTLAVTGASTLTGNVTAAGTLAVIGATTLTGATTASSTLAVTGAASFTVGLDNPTGVIAPTWTSKTQMANGFSAALVKNTHYVTPTDGNAFTATLPTQASSTVGDTIILEWHDDVNTTEIQKVGTSGEFYTTDSIIYRSSGSGGNLIYTTDTADGSTHDFARFIGLLAAGPGVGSVAVFTFNGSTWTLEARLTSSGAASDDNASVFSTS